MENKNKERKDFTIPNSKLDEMFFAIVSNIEKQINEGTRYIDTAVFVSGLHNSDMSTEKPENISEASAAAEFPDGIPDDADARFGMFKSLGRALMSQGLAPWLVTSVSEAWMANYEACSEEDKRALDDGETRIKDLETKKEVVIVSSLCVDGRTAFACFTVDRDKENKMVLVEKEQKLFSEGEESNYEGVRLHLLAAVYEGAKLQAIQKDDLSKHGLYMREVGPFWHEDADTEIH